MWHGHTRLGGVAELQVLQAHIQLLVRLLGSAQDLSHAPLLRSGPEMLPLHLHALPVQSLTSMRPIPSCPICHCMPSQACAQALTWPRSLPKHMLHLPCQLLPGLSEGCSIRCLCLLLSRLYASASWRIHSTSRMCMSPQLLLHLSLAVMLFTQLPAAQG